MNEVTCQITGIFLSYFTGRTHFCVFSQLEAFFFTLLGGSEMNIDMKIKITSKGLQFSISSTQLPPSFRVLLFCMVCLTKEQDLPCSLIF